MRESIDSGVDTRFRGIVGAVRCDDYTPALVADAVRNALEPFGGLGTFVRPGYTVLLKPNLVSPHPPEDAVTTHPSLVRAVAVMCKECGAAKVWIGDSPAGAHVDTVLWERTGMKAAAEQCGAELRSFGVREIESVRCGAERVPVPEWLGEVDVIISLPKFKTHALTGLTCAMKNVFGLVVGEAKSMAHARRPSPREMSAFLVDVYAALRPHLSIVDAVTVMEGEGPTNGRPRSLGLVLAGVDAAAIDAVCARFLPGNGRAAPMLKYAAQRDLGETRFEAVRVVGDGSDVFSGAVMRPSMARWLMRLPNSLFKPVTYLLAARPRIRQKQCVRCGACAKVCSQNAIVWNETWKRFDVHKEHCILCMCCLESCPHQAIEVRSPIIWLSRVSGALRYSRKDGGDTTSGDALDDPEC